MLGKLRSILPSPSMLVALAALAVALSGTAYAATTIGTGQLGNGAVTTPKLHNGAVTTTKLAGGAVTNGKVKNNAVTSGKVKDGSLLARDFKPGELSVGQVQGVQGPPGPQGPAGPPGAASGTAGSVALTPEDLPAGTLPTLHTVVAVGHARLQAACYRQPIGTSQVVLQMAAADGGIIVLATRIGGAAPLSPGGSVLLESHGPSITNLGDVAVFDKAGPSSRGTYATYVEPGAGGACMVTAHMGV
jgi:hypothetical protein